MGNEIFGESKNVGIYPNPSSGIFNLDLTNEVDVFDNVFVFNVLGQNILTQTVNAKAINEIDLSDFSSGYYLAKLVGENGNANVKLLKE